MYRPNLKTVDCTIRDGGLMNKSQFSLKTVRAVFKAVCDAGVDYVELGYKNSDKYFSREKYGAWRFCDEQDLRAATDGIEHEDTKIAVMMDAHKSFADDILPKEESVVDLIRVATYVKDVDKAIYIANDAMAKGYEAGINIMSVSVEGGKFLDEALHQIEEETKVKVVYVVDSFGALYSEEVDFYIEKFQSIIKTKEVGVHFHNNQQLAFANTIQGIIRNANYVDGTLLGLGRGAGNCPLELLMSFLKNPKFKILPLIEAIQDEIRPLTKTLAWGYHIPYMLTGVLNRHPLPAMEWLEKQDPDSFVDFYREITESN
jgi:4-hydroxy 2-oxovalerate aldolase